MTITIPIMSNMWAWIQSLTWLQSLSWQYPCWSCQTGELGFNPLHDYKVSRDNIHADPVKQVSLDSIPYMITKSLVPISMLILSNRWAWIQSLTWLQSLSCQYPCWSCQTGELGFNPLHDYKVSRDNIHADPVKQVSLDSIPYMITKSLVTISMLILSNRWAWIQSLTWLQSLSWQYPCWSCQTGELGFNPLHDYKVSRDNIHADPVKQVSLDSIPYMITKSLVPISVLILSNRWAWIQSLTWLQSLSCQYPCWSCQTGELGFNPLHDYKVSRANIHADPVKQVSLDSLIQPLTQLQCPS